MSAGFWFSTSRCHSTICQRSGSEANALAAAPPSKPATAVSVNGTPGSNGVMSSVVVELLLAPHLVDVQAAYGGQQVGAERDIGPAAAEQHVEHLDERLGDQVVGVGAAHQQPGQPGGGVDVPGEQRPVGAHVALTDPGDQLRIRQFVGGGVGGAHGAMAALRGVVRELPEFIPVFPSWNRCSAVSSPRPRRGG